MSATGQFLALLARNRLALGGLIVLGVVVLLAILTPILPLKPDYVTDTGNRFLPPFSESALLGTGHLGCNLLSRLMWGTRHSLAVGFAAAFVAAATRASIGIIAGYYGGRTDNVVMRGVDMLMAFPYILLPLADSAPVVCSPLQAPETQDNELPDPLNPPGGPAFRALCTFASPICAQQVPDLTFGEGERAVGCHHPMAG